MSNKFKKGDLVECVDATGTGEYVLRPGTIYQVDGFSSCGYVRITAYPGNALGFLPHRFVLCNPSDIQAPRSKRLTTLPTDSNARKDIPMHRGCLRYFPAALAGVANTSKLGNDKHNPGEDMHHARNKSTDQTDCILRHLMDVEDLVAALERGDLRATPETILIEVNQLAWRALAFSQELHERFGAPLAPGAKETGSKK